MGDVWWGLVETSSEEYDWDAYLELAGYIKAAGLTWQPVMSFHSCGGNVGDDCDIPLPDWVTSVGATNPDIYYTDQDYSPDDEYLSLGVDNEVESTPDFSWVISTDSLQWSHTT